MNPTDRQLILYEELQQIIEQHWNYSDQIMAIAIYVDKKYIEKSKVKHLK